MNRAHRLAAATIGLLAAAAVPRAEAQAVEQGRHDFTDLWWNVAESGWGFTLTQHASTAAFGILFAYDASTSPRWFTMSGGRWVSPQTFVGRFYASTGPGYLQNSFDPAVVTRTQVGAVRLSFADRDQGTLVYTIDGVLRTKAISRLPY